MDKSEAGEVVYEDGRGSVALVGEFAYKLSVKTCLH